MKTKKYIINTYKGNLLESVKRFQNAHEGVKIFEAVEKNNKLEITAEALNSNIINNFVNKAKKQLAAGGENLHKALKKLYSALGAHADIHSALHYEDFTEEEKELIEQFFKKVHPRAWAYSWKPYDDGSFTDEESEAFAQIMDLVNQPVKKKFLFIFKWNNNYEWGEGSIEANDLESAKTAFAEEMEYDSYKEFDNKYHVNEILQIPTQSVKKIM